MSENFNKTTDELIEIFNLNNEKVDIIRSDEAKFFTVSSILGYVKIEDNLWKPTLYDINSVTDKMRI